MEWDILYVLQMGKPQTFQELATKAHDIEVTIANRYGSSFNVTKSKNGRNEFKKNAKFSKSSNKDGMTISKAEPSELWEDQTRKRKEACPSRTR